LNITVVYHNGHVDSFFCGNCIHNERVIVDAGRFFLAPQFIQPLFNVTMRDARWPEER
jgi:hypothetical protein